MPWFLFTFKFCPRTPHPGCALPWTGPHTGYDQSPVISWVFPLAIDCTLPEGRGCGFPPCAWPGAQEILNSRWSP